MTEPQNITDITWSHSSLEQFDGCPLQYYEFRVSKNYKQGRNKAMDRGNQIHSAVEHYLKGDVNVTHVPLDTNDREQFDRFKPLITRYEAMRAFSDGEGIEMQIVLDGHGRETSWFDRNCRVRAKLDWCLFLNGRKTLFTVDWKTGGIYADKAEAQAKRYAWLAFRRWPELEEVVVQFAYFDELTTTDAYTYTRDQMDWLIQPTKETLNQILEAHQTGIWPARKNFRCRWCEVRSCQHSPN